VASRLRSCLTSDRRVTAFARTLNSPRSSQLRLIVSGLVPPRADEDAMGPRRCVFSNANVSIVFRLCFVILTITCLYYYVDRNSYARILENASDFLLCLMDGQTGAPH
jgi:hypothetical protein